MLDQTALLAEAPGMQLAFALEREGHPDLNRDAGELAGLARSNIPLSGDALAALATLGGQVNAVQEYASGHVG